MERRGVSSRVFIRGVVVVSLVAAGILVADGPTARAEIPPCMPQPLPVIEGPFIASTWHGVASRSGAQALNFGGSLLNIPGLESLAVQFYQATCQGDGTTGSEQFFHRSMLAARGIRSVVATFDCLDAQQFVGFTSGSWRVDLGIECFSPSPKIFGSVRNGPMTVDSHVFTDYTLGGFVTLRAQTASNPTRLEYEIVQLGQTFTHSVSLPADVTSIRPHFGAAGMASGGVQPRVTAIQDTAAFATCP